MVTSACASCGRPVPSAARFCPACGHRVDGRSGMLEERRVVTVLFADIVGYTTLAEHLDPENVKQLLAGCFERLTADIESYGGRVDKLLGDAVVALFGAPVAHEDDAERAVRAGLQMQDTVARFVSERQVLDPTGAPIRMRVGINTGEVLVGTMSGTDYTATGDVVNTASRLQTVAPPGGVLIGDATAALLSPVIHREPHGVTAIRGRQQDEQPWLVTGAAPAGARPVRDDVPFVGRNAERRLLDATAELVRRGDSAAVSIIGEAGVGKTRLACELIDALEPDAIVLRTGCAPYGASSVWAPLAAAISAILRINPEATADDVRRSVEKQSRGLWSLDPDDAETRRYVSVINHLLGHAGELDHLDAAGAHDVVAGALTAMLRRSAATRMTVLWVDDLQWADPVLLEQLAIVVRSLAELPFLLITAQRTDDAVWTPTVERTLVVRVPLGQLERSDAMALVRNVIEREQPGGDTSDRRVSALVDRGGGSPLYLVELAAMSACCEPNAELPGSLRALLAARLDRLPPAQRAIVENAAILGSSDAVASLERFAAAMHQDFRDSDLAELAATGLLDVDGPRWWFRSDVVRDVAYRTLTKRARAQRHGGVVQVLRREKPHLVAEIAHHAATAAELQCELGEVAGLPDDVGELAVDSLLSAARAAADAGHYEQAVRHSSRAIDLHVADSATSRELLLIRATVATERRASAEALADAERVLDAALADGHMVHEAEARQLLGTIAQVSGDVSTARRELDRSIELLRSADQPARLANALRARGFAEVFGGSLGEARRFLGDAMDLYHQLDDERGHAWTHQNLAWVAFHSGDFADADQQLVEAQKMFEALGDRAGVTWASGLRAWVAYFQRRFDDAEQLAGAVEAESRRWGNSWPSLMMQTLLANLRLWTGRLAEAEHLADRALTGFRSMNDRYGIMQALAPLNRARAGLGKRVEAERGVEESIALGQTFGELTIALQGAAGVAMHLGAADQAYVIAEQALERHRASGSDDAEAIVLGALAQAQRGRVDDALALIERVEVGDFPFGRAARALIRAVAGEHDEARRDAIEVVEGRAASYFDTALARLAEVVAARGSDGRDVEETVERFTALASSVGDVVLLDVAALMTTGDRDRRRTATGAAGDGWQQLVAGITAA